MSVTIDIVYTTSFGWYTDIR